VLLLGDGRPVVGGPAVRIGDRLALDGDLLVRDRHGHLLVLGHDVLAQPGPPGLPGLGADVEPLLRAGHGRIGGRAGGVVTPRADLVHVGRPTGGGPGPGVVPAVVPGGGAVVEVVVAVEPLLLLPGQVVVPRHVRCVLHPGLVVADGHRAGAAVEVGARERDEALARAEEPRVHGDPLRPLGVVVVVDLTDPADLVAVPVVGGGAHELLDVLLADHQWLCPLSGVVERSGVTDSPGGGSGPPRSLDRV
jgi:hypothetical protein